MSAVPNGTFSHAEQRCHRKLEHALSSLPSEYVNILTDVASAKTQCNTSILEDNKLLLANPSFYHSMHLLLMKQIVDALPPKTFSWRERQSRASLEDALVGLFIIHQSMLLDVVAAKKQKRVEDFNDSLDHRMRKKLKPSNDFPFIVSKKCRQSRIVKFIDATGSNALAISVCTVCAGSFFASEVCEVLVSQLQEKKLLRLFQTHPTYVLTSGMLLHRSLNALHTVPDGVLSGNICDSCTHALQRNKTPPLSLANGIWIGDVPSELSILTLPERILVARYFPAAYIHNLKKRGGKRHSFTTAFYYAESKTFITLLVFSRIAVFVKLQN